MGAVAGIEDRIVFEDDYSCLDRVQGGTTLPENGPTGGEGAAAAFVARDDGIVGDIPGPAVNDEGRLHGGRIVRQKRARQGQGRQRAAVPSGELDKEVEEKEQQPDR